MRRISQLVLLVITMVLGHAASAADDHGNIPATATQVAVGSVTPGALEQGGDRDYFKFVAPTTGTYVVYTRGTTNTNGTLYDSNYGFVTSNGSAGENDNFKIVSLLQPGTYYVEVSHNLASGTGSYALHVEGPGGGTVSDDHGSSPWSATAVGIGSVIAGVLEQGNDHEYFKFVAPTTGTYVVYTRGTTNTNGTLYDSNYGFVTSNGSAGENDNFKIVSLLQPGTYYVEVSHNLASGTGSYALHVEGPGGGTVSDDHGSSPWSATAVGIGSVTAGVLEQGNDHDYFKFVAPTTGTYVVYTRGTTNTNGTLYDSNYGFVTSNGSAGENDNFKIVSLLQPGTYYVEVSHNLASGTGSYALHVEGPGGGTVSDDHGSSPWSATAMGIGSITAGVLEQGNDEDYFKFVVAVSATYVVYTAGTTDTSGVLYDANYGFVASDGSSGENGNFKITRALPPGTYYVEISHNFASGTGSYQLHVEGPPGGGTIGVPVANPPNGSFAGNTNVSVSATNAQRIYCAIRTTLDSSVPSDPLEPTETVNDACGLGSPNYIVGSSGTFVLIAPASGIKRVKVRFRAWNGGQWSGSSVYEYEIGPTSVAPGVPVANPPNGSFPGSTNIGVSAPNAQRIYCAIRTAVDGSVPSDPPEPTETINDPCGPASPSYIVGSSGNFVLIAPASGIKRVTVRFRAWNGGQWSSSSVYAYDVGSTSAVPGVPVANPPNGSFPGNTNISVSAPNAQRIYCTLRTTLDGSNPAEPPDPTDTLNDPCGLVSPNYINSNSGNFVLIAPASGIKRVKVRFRAWNSGQLGLSSASYEYTVGASAGVPGGAVASPASGTWTNSPQYLAVSSIGATAIYFQMVNTYDGSDPADPDIPTSTTNNGALAGPSATFEYYGAPRVLKRTKLRFVGCNSAGCGPPSFIYSYSIELPAATVDTPPNRPALSGKCLVATPAACASGNDKAVVITHGYHASVFDWVVDLASAVCKRVGATQPYTGIPVDDIMPRCSGNGWDVWVFDWRTLAFAGAKLNPLDAWINAGTLGPAVSKYFRDNHRYNHFHLIGHSAGSKLIETATPGLKLGRDLKPNGTTVHATFLDAFDPSAVLHGSNGRHVSSYGQFADVADNYVDTREVFSSFLDTTDLHLTYGYNVDVTPNPDGCEGGDSCNHSRPYRFYGISVDPFFVGNADYAARDPISGTANVGFNFSLENNKSLDLLQRGYADGAECLVGSDNVCHPVALSPGVLHFLPGAVAGSIIDATAGAVSYALGAGATLLSTVGLGPVSPSVVSKNQARAFVPSAVPTEPPSSIGVQVTTTQPVDTLRFGWRFNAAGEGFLRVFVDGVLVRELDQRHLPLVSAVKEEVYIGNEAGPLPPGTHRIAFRLDGFDTAASRVDLSDVEVGARTIGGNATVPNYQGMWAVPNLAEAGWGINFTHQDDILFASWFTYDAAGKPLWLTMTAQQQSDGSFTGAIDRTAGPPFSAAPFNPAQVTHAVQGTGRLIFSDANNGTFSYTVNGVTQTKTLTRFVYASPAPVCTFNSALAPPQATNYQDMWAVPNLAEAGWGINFTHQGDLIFASWFTYDQNGIAYWVTGTLAKSGTRTYAGPLDSTTGPAFNAVPFNPASVTHSTAGTATVTFTDGANATFAYTLNGVTQTKALTRFVFRTPGTVCQ